MKGALSTLKNNLGSESALLFAILAVLWAVPFVIVAPLWPSALYYDYAPIVPALALFLLWQRRDALGRCSFDRLRALDYLPLVVGLVALGGLAFLTAGTASWRILNLSSALVAAGLTLYLFFRLGGGRIAVGMLGIVAVLLTAFPWPIPLEKPVIDHFTEGVIAFNARFLPLFGLPAVASGNRLLVEGQAVSVAEACSGLKSLQMLLAFALFAGEFQRLRFGARLTLLAAVIPVAFVVNVGRASFLAYASFAWGEAAYDRWHDPIGYLSMTVSGGALLLLSSRLPGVASRLASASPAPAPRTRPGPRAAALAGLALLALVLAALVAVRLQRPEAPAGLATLHLPAEWSARSVEVPEEARTMLLCEDLQRYSFPLPGGRTAEIYLMRWNDLVAGYTDVSIHRPDVCMVHYQGGQLVEGPSLRVLDPAVLPDPVQFWRIRYAGGDPTLRVYRQIGAIRDGALETAGWAEAVEGGFTFARKRDLALAAHTDHRPLFAVLIALDATLPPATADALAAEILVAARSSLLPHPGSTQPDP